MRQEIKYAMNKYEYTVQELVTDGGKKTMTETTVNCRCEIWNRWDLSRPLEFVLLSFCLNY